MTLPNWITVARMALVPVFVLLAYEDSDATAIAALAVFGIASATDRLDGYLARKHGSISRLGQFLDPLADKILVGAALYVLVDSRGFPLWAALVIAAREVAVQILRIRVVSTGGTMPASTLAKSKTVFQIVMVSWWLLPIQRGLIHWILLTLALVSTVISGVEYFRHARPIEEVPS